MTLPDCPEINGLAVWPADRQSHGIGTAIIHAAETLAAQRGYHHIGLGVDDQNPRAAALYLRLGYNETGCTYLDRTTTSTTMAPATTSPTPAGS